MATEDKRDPRTDDEEIEAMKQRLIRRFGLEPEESTPPKETWICGICGVQNMKDNPDCWNRTAHST